MHHLIPRSAGGSDDLGNLVLLCDGCHGARHPNLHASLARRTIEAWTVRLAKWIDLGGRVPKDFPNLGVILRVLGKQRLREGQLEVVLAAFRGESVLMVAPTGSGKSLCFELPTLARPGTALVLSPLKQLMSSQVTGLHKSKIPSTFVNGDLGPAEKELRYNLLKGGLVKFFFCTPERFDPSRVRVEEIERLADFRPSFFVVDEAHVVDKWGDDFRPSYGRLGAVRESLGNPPVLAFTATAGINTQRRILESLGIPRASVFVRGANRPNIGLIRSAAIGSDRLDKTARLIESTPGRILIFVPTKKIGREVQDGLRIRGFDIPFYHSSMGTANDRELLAGRFLGRIDPPLQALISTNAFGMGIDIPDIRLVIHWQHPASPEDYLQEFGRAGRDGRQSFAVLYTSHNDAGLQRFMAERTAETAESSARGAVLKAKFDRIEAMNVLSRSDRCFRRGLLEYFGERSAPPSWSIRLLEWAFAEKRRVTRGPCCEACDPVLTVGASEGSLPFGSA